MELLEPAKAPVLLAAGRDADVYALDAGRVLRRSRLGADVSAHGAVLTHLHRLGYPVPAVYSASGTDLVLERVEGPTMLRALTGGELGTPEAAELLAELHTRLHRLPARLSPDSRARILHRDLHPDNVIMSSRGPVVIDWCNAAEGAPELDVAVSALILAEVAVQPAGGLAGPAREMLAEFLGVAGAPPPSALYEARRYRGANPTLSADERGRLGAAVRLVEAIRPTGRSWRKEP
ncbi:phosphotransferase [Micromonospora sp. NPDC049559]|uniref:phosphotransferase n=1 Tax=Micromonospora sp. NPDC049559 TaxID=3155923 RepID=UPI003420C508